MKKFVALLCLAVFAFCISMVNHLTAGDFFGRGVRVQIDHGQHRGFNNFNSFNHFNSFSTRTVVDSRGNLYTVDAFGRKRFIGNKFNSNRSIGFSRSSRFHSNNRFNAFGTQTVVDSHGNVFAVDAFGRKQFLGNKFDRGSNFSINIHGRGFRGFGFDADDDD